MKNDSKAINGIMREWRGTVAKENADDYEKVLRATGLAEYASVPGNRGVWLLRADFGELTEFTTLTLWDSNDAIREFAGDPIQRARYYPEDEGYLVDRPEFVRHYAVRWTG